MTECRGLWKRGNSNEMCALCLWRKKRGASSPHLFGRSRERRLCLEKNEFRGAEDSGFLDPKPEQRGGFHWSRHLGRIRPELFWEMSREVQSTIAKAQPSPAHISLAEMEKQELVSCVNTQNLHKLAGSAFVFELHGNAVTSTRMMCHEQMPPLQAIGQLQDQVSPANMIVKFCQRRTGRVIVVDPDPSVRPQADLLLCGQDRVVLPQLLEACLANRNVSSLS